MAVEVKLPRLGQGMESGTIVKWLKSEGDELEKGDPLYELDTDKVTQEVEADASGVLLKIAVLEGDVPVGTTIAFVGEAGEEVHATAPSRTADTPGAETATAVASSEPERVRGQEGRTEEPGTEPAPAARAEAGRIKASPLARRIARERGIDLAALRGTGPEGRILGEDVERAEQALTPAEVRGEVEQRALSTVRRTSARRLTEAWQVPVFQLVASADMTSANKLLARVRERDPELRVTVTDLLTKVCAAALVLCRDMNVQYSDDGLLVFPHANVGIAVATPQGLVVPVIHRAEQLSLAEIAAARADAVGRARKKELRPEDLQQGTFTISNLGMFGVEQFTAVVNTPQAAILAVGSTEDRVVPVGGQIAIRPLVTLTLTCDHRALDGATAAEFLRTLRELLEEPALAL